MSKGFKLLISKWEYLMLEWLQKETEMQGKAVSEPTLLSLWFKIRFLADTYYKEIFWGLTKIKTKAWWRVVKQSL